MRKSRLEARAVKMAAQGHWIEIFQVLAPESNHAIEKLGRHVICPVHGGQDGDGYRLFKDFNQTGGAVCNTCGGHRDGFSHLMWLKGWTFPETLEQVAACLGISDAESIAARPTAPDPEREAARRKAEAEQQRKDEKARKDLDEVWKGAVPLSDPAAEPARLYLARRGLALRYALQFPALRFNPAVKCFHGKKLLGTFPAMVALMFDAEGRPASIHRTYITAEGYKAPVPQAKKLMPYPSNRSVSGGAIRLMEPAGPVLAYTEGIETALAVIEATEGRLPVWPAATDTLLANANPPEHVELVVFYGDQDRNEAGKNAILKAKEKLWKESKQVMAFLPAEPIPETAKGVDWLDVLNRYGVDGIPFPETLEQRLRA